MPLISGSLSTIENVIQYVAGIGESIPGEHSLNVEFNLNAASEAISQFCERRFQKQTYTSEFHTGIKNQTILYPHQSPIVSVSSVMLDSTSIVEGTDSNQWRKHRTSDGTWTGLYRQESWLSNPYGVEISYVAGFVLPGNPGRDLPMDVEQCAIRLALQEYFHRGSQGTSNETFSGLSLSFDRWPGDLVKTLSRYRIVRY